MKQYCRYCSHCVYGDVAYCEELNKTMGESSAKRANNCDHFEFNEIDVFNFEHKYKPRKQKEETISLFEEQL